MNTIALGLMAVLLALNTCLGREGQASRFVAGGTPEVWSIVELRQYTLHQGKRDVLIDLFDAEFVEPQEAAGMKVIGQFRDLDRPDRFVWLRAFPDMPARARALTAFYSGPTWAAHKTLANSTMIDFDDILLLRTSRPRANLPAVTTPRPAGGTAPAPSAMIAATIYSFSEHVDPEFATFFERTLQPALTRVGLPVLVTLVTEDSPNNFPALPVRSENAFVWLTRTASAAEYSQAIRQLGAQPGWPQIAAELQGRLRKPPEVLRLQPTSRSELR